jgi:hypothetical protein
MADTAARLDGPEAIGTAEETLITVAGATTAIIRNIHIANTSAAGATFKMSIGADAAATRLFSDVRVEAYSAFDWSGFLVLGTGETLRAQSGTADVLTCTISGVNVT